MVCGVPTEARYAVISDRTLLSDSAVRLLVDEASTNPCASGRPIIKKKLTVLLLSVCIGVKMITPS